MPALADSEVERALVIVAHPDDAEFWAGGTIAGWTKAGIEVTYCVLTDGDNGGFDPAVPRADIPAIRRAEQHAAAAHLGVSEIRFLGLGEGNLRAGIAVRVGGTWRIAHIQLSGPLIKPGEMPSFAR